MNRIAQLITSSLAMAVIVTAGTLATVSHAAADAAATAAAKLEAAMTADQRPAADKARDQNRKPIETLEFFGFEPDMRVLELLPGGGWYTRLLASALQGSGQLYVAIGTQRIEESLLKEPAFAAVEVAEMSGDFSRADGARRYTLTDLALELEDIDLVLTFRNVHNFDAESRASINQAVFAVLKPGGHYGVVDHTRRHMAEDDAESWRRMDPVQVIKEMQAAGFEFVDYSDLHFRPDDELRYEVGRASVAGNTDRFTLLFRKPE